MANEPEFFGPADCDEFGNTFYPFIFRGKLSDDGWSVDILDKPTEFRPSDIDSVATAHIARTSETWVRMLDNNEVKQFVTANGRRSLREELRAAKQSSIPKLSM